MVVINNREIKRPAVVCDNIGYVILKVGEYEDMLHYYKVARKAYSMLDCSELNQLLESVGLPKIGVPVERTLELIELPQNQSVVDNILRKTGYLEEYLERYDKNVIKINFEPVE